MRKVKHLHKKIISFGQFETATVLINVLLIKVLLGMPQLLCYRAGSAAWLVAIGSGAFFLLVLAGILLLYRRFEGKSIMDIAGILGGRPLEIITAVLVILPILFKGAMTLRLAADTIHIITPFQLPSVLTAVFIGAAIIITSYKGIEGVVRMHALMVPVILAALVIVVTASASSFHLTNLYPFWGLGQKTVWRESFTILASYTDIIYVFLLYPYVKAKKQFNRACLWGGGIGVAFTVGIILTYVLSTQYPENTQLFMPVYQVSRLIRFGLNSQSIEAIFFPVWVLSSLLYLCMSNYFIVEILGQVTRTQYEKLFIVPVAAAMFLTAYSPKSIMSAMKISSQAALPLVCLTMVLPAAVLALAAWKSGRKRRNRHEA